jgi:hypothetical protein
MNAWRRFPNDIPVKWIRVAIVLALLAISALLGWRAPSMAYGGLGIEALVVGIVLVMALIAAFRYIEFGVFAIVLTAFFVRFTLPTGTASRIPASMLLTGLMVGVWFIYMFLRHQVHFVPARSNLPLLGFVLVSMISYPWSWLSWRPEFWAYEPMFKFQIAQFGGLLAMTLLPASLFLSLNLLRDKKWVTRVLIALVIIALPELIQRLSNRPLVFGGLGISGPGLYHSWLVAILYAQLLFNQSLKVWQKVLFVVLILGWFYYGFVVMIKWISGWFPLMTSLVFLTYLKSKKAVVIAMLVLAIPFILSADYYYEHVIAESVRDDSNRLWLWQTILFDLTLTKAGIVFGAGPAGYTPYFMTYYPGQSMSAHNNYVDIIAETGIVGTFFFFWFLYETLRVGWKQSKELKDTELVAFNNGVLGGFVAMIGAMMLDDWFIPFVYNNGLPGFDMNVYAWIMIGMMLGLSKLKSASAPSEAPATP